MNKKQRNNGPSPNDAGFLIQPFLLLQTHEKRFKQANERHILVCLPGSLRKLFHVKPAVCGFFHPRASFSIDIAILQPIPVVSRKM